MFLRLVHCQFCAPVLTHLCVEFNFSTAGSLLRLTYTGAVLAPSTAAAVVRGGYEMRCCCNCSTSVHAPMRRRGKALFLWRLRGISQIGDRISRGCTTYFDTIVALQLATEYYLCCLWCGLRVFVPGCGFTPLTACSACAFA